MTDSDRPVALVTGASRGLGRASAERLGAEGWRVFPVYRNPRWGTELDLAFEGRALQGDLAGPRAGELLVDDVLRRAGRLDAVVHAIGDYALASLEDVAAETFRGLVESNLFSAVALVDAARDALREGGGSIVLFGCAGLEALRARRTNPAYTAAKTALLSYMRSLALEEIGHGVRVNMVSPGVVPHPGASADTLDPKLQARIPAGRAANPEEIAAAVAWFLSAEAGHVTGQNLEVAGGWLL